MKALCAAIALLIMAGCGGGWSGGESDPMYGTNGKSYIKQQDAYGLGTHMDQYGRPVTVQPMPGYGSSSNSYIQKQDAYGPGVSMDQYGRPVRVSP